MKREDIIEQGKRLLTDVKEDEHFKTIDGRTLKSVRELVLLLETYHDDHFNHHVNEHRNDFAAWVEHSIGDRVLADRIRAADSQLAIQQAIAGRLEELEHQLLALERGEAPEHVQASEHETENLGSETDASDDELEALVGDVDPDARFGRDELLEEIESAIAQAQAQLKVERTDEQRESTDLTGEPDQATSEPADAAISLEDPTSSRAERKLAREAEKARKREEREAKRRENEKEKARKKAQKRREKETNKRTNETQEGPSGFSLADFFVGFGFGALIGGVLGVIIALLFL